MTSLGQTPRALTYEKEKNMCVEWRCDMYFQTAHRFCFFFSACAHEHTVEEQSIAVTDMFSGAIRFVSNVLARWCNCWARIRCMSKRWKLFPFCLSINSNSHPSHRGRTDCHLCGTQASWNHGMQCLRGNLSVADSSMSWMAWSARWRNSCSW